MLASPVYAEGMPARPLLIFDGDCAFCTSCENWAAKRIQHEAVPWQFADLDALGLTNAQAQESIWLFDNGQVYSGSDAAAALLRRADAFGWRFAGELMSLPGIRNLARPAYRVLARHRHQMPGGTAACELKRAE